MSDYRQMQELQEQKESEALSALVKVAWQGCEEEAFKLANQLGLTNQLKKEIQHAVER